MVCFVQPASNFFLKTFLVPVNIAAFIVKQRITHFTNMLHFLLSCSPNDGNVWVEI